MKTNVFLISSIRQSLRTFLLIVLIGVISFAFISKAAEFLVVRRETNRIGSYYRAIGNLTLINPDSTDMIYGEDIYEGAELIADSPYLSVEDRRRISSGVMEDLYNSDINGNSSERDSEFGQLLKGLHNSDMWFYGTLSGMDEILYIEKDILNPTSSGEEEIVGYTLKFRVEEVVAGYPEHIRAGTTKAFLFLFEDIEDAIPSIEAMEEGQRYLIRGWNDVDFQVDPNWWNVGSTLKIRPLDDDALWYLPVDEGKEVDFNDPTLAYVKNEIDILIDNQHALLIVATKDMSALPLMQESARTYYLVEGRWLNRQDDLEGRKAMVITAGLA